MQPVAAQALFAEAKRIGQNWDHTFGSWAACGPIFGSRIWPLFWGHKTQTGASQCGQQVCYCRRKLTAAHIRDTVKPASWHQAQENMNGRCNLSQLNALFAEGKTHTPWAQNWDHTFGSWAANFSIVAPFLESGPCFGATKHKQELVNAGSKCATADASSYPYTVKPASWPQENMNGRCNLSQLNAPFGRQNAYTMGPKLGIWKLVILCIFGSRIWPLFRGHKTQTGASQCGQQVCYCRRKLTAAHIRDTPRVHARGACFTTYLRLRFWGLGPT